MISRGYRSQLICLNLLNNRSKFDPNAMGDCLQLCLSLGYVKHRIYVSKLSQVCSTLRATVLFCQFYIFLAIFEVPY